MCCLHRMRTTLCDKWKFRTLQSLSHAICNRDRRLLTSPCVTLVGAFGLICLRLLRGRWGLWAPGAIGLVVGSLILFTITDDPESGGFEPVESGKKGGRRAALVDSAQHHGLCHPLVA